MRDRKVYVFGTPQLPASPVRIYLDVEGAPEEGFDYLVGLIVVVGDQEQRYSFWADTRDQEGEIFEQFLGVVGRYDDYLVFAYGRYERAFLKRMRNRARKKAPVDRVLKSLVNVLALVYAHFYFPTYSNGLKEVGACLGCSWSAPDASSTQSIVWRMRWEATRDEQWKQQLMTYNMEDCAALKRVTELLYSVRAGPVTPVGGVTPGAQAPQVEWVQDIERWANGRSWGKVQFADPQFEHINQCAYFDYQRERVFVRSSARIRRSQRPKRQRRQKLRVTQHVTLVSRKCPRCGGTSLTTEFDRRNARCPIPRAKRAYDLRVTAGGIRRKVIECKASAHRCLACGHAFVPAAHERVDKHFHGLKSWVIYQHVAHDLALEPIRTMISEFFGVRVHFCEIYMFKRLMARYYRATYRALLRKILSGNLLHVDETEVPLRRGKGYVWVFTNLEEVVYVFRPSREGEFLKKLLADFHGVLVSDFYAAYDSLNCPQQKCLIHLIRDLNQELLSNPFDEEVRAITQPFGALLRAAVGTIDEHGLKRRHLVKHVGEKETFFRALASQTFHSEAAEALRSRLLKYQDKLVTFLEHDGVPWNNNAEHAVKQFASYRENRVGMMTEGGLSDYLVLLSLCQTCRYRGISFLKFLLSREQEIDAFGMRGRARRRRPLIEVYPKNFIPPHLARLRARATQKPGEPTEWPAERESRAGVSPEPAP